MLLMVLQNICEISTKKNRRQSFKNLNDNFWKNESRLWIVSHTCHIKNYFETNATRLCKKQHVFLKIKRL